MEDVDALQTAVWQWELRNLHRRLLEREFDPQHRFFSDMDTRE